MIERWSGMSYIVLQKKDEDGFDIADTAGRHFLQLPEHTEKHGRAGNRNGYQEQMYENIFLSWSDRKMVSRRNSQVQCKKSWTRKVR